MALFFLVFQLVFEVKFHLLVHPGLVSVEGLHQFRQARSLSVTVPVKVDHMVRGQYSLTCHLTTVVILWWARLCGDIFPSSTGLIDVIDTLSSYQHLLKLFRVRVQFVILLHMPFESTFSSSSLFYELLCCRREHTSEAVRFPWLDHTSSGFEEWVWYIPSLLSLLLPHFSYSATSHRGKLPPCHLVVRDRNCPQGKYYRTPPGPAEPSPTPSCLRQPRLLEGDGSRSVPSRRESEFGNDHSAGLPTETL